MKLFSSDYFYILLLSAVLMALIFLAGAPGQPLALQIVRGVLGLVFVLFIPGYCLQAFAFPSPADLDGKERLAISFGLSLAVLPAILLLLDYLPSGITVASASISLLILVLLFTLLGWLRRSRLPESDRYQPLQELNLLARWRALAPSYRAAYILLGVTLLLAAALASSILTSPKAAGQFTEFYILGAEGRAELYPREGTAGQPISVTVGIHNQEGVAALYYIEVRDGQGQIGLTEPFLLEPGAAVEQPLTFSPVQTGDDVEINLYLYRDTRAEPYRSLQLWLKVKPAS